jgi:hypothetical protein
MSKFEIFCAMPGVAGRSVSTNARNLVSGSFALETEEDVRAIIQDFFLHGGT